METIVEIKDLDVSYGSKRVLKGVSLDIKSNAITAIIGPSGCGKTTLLHAMNGQLSAEGDARIDGRIRLAGRDIAKIPSEELHRRVGLVFQTPAPFPFSIYKNMTYALKYYGVRKKAELDEIVEEKLRMVGLYDEVKDELGRSALKLSGGQQQRLCIARALTAEPEVLLLDEPCSALDVKSTSAIEDMLCDLKNAYTIVIVTHNIGQARRIADDVVLLFDGHVVESGDAEEFFESPSEPLTREFLSGAFG